MNKGPEKGRQQQESLPQEKRQAARLAKKNRGAGEPREVAGEPHEGPGGCWVWWQGASGVWRWCRGDEKKERGGRSWL